MNYVNRKLTSVNMFQHEVNPNEITLDFLRCLIFFLFHEAKGFSFSQTHDKYLWSFEVSLYFQLIFGFFSPGFLSSKRKEILCFLSTKLYFHLIGLPVGCFRCLIILLTSVKINYMFRNQAADVFMWMLYHSFFFWRLSFTEAKRSWKILQWTRHAYMKTYRKCYNVLSTIVRKLINNEKVSILFSAYSIWFNTILF